MATEPIDLVIAGIKRQRPAWRAITVKVASRSKHGDFVILLDGEGRRQFIGRTTR
jgi:uncharacterized protein YhfF